MPRDYKKERRDYYGYGKYSSVTPEQQKHRREMAGRKKAKKMVGKCKGEVHHKNHNAHELLDLLESQFLHVVCRSLVHVLA